MSNRAVEAYEFPSPTGVNYYEYYIQWSSWTYEKWKEFPSPTGVNYYELVAMLMVIVVNYIGFRPQQGLTIMNMILHHMITMCNTQSFRPQQGLTIMNVKREALESIN